MFRYQMSDQDFSVSFISFVLPSGAKAEGVASGSLIEGCY